MGQTVQEFAPAGQVGGVEVLYLEFAYNQFVQVLRVHIERYLINAPGVYALDYVSWFHIAEQRDFPADVIRERMFGAADYHVRLYASLLEHLHRVLRRLGLQLLGRIQERHQREMYAHTVLFRKFPLELAHGLYEGLGFHISHGASYFSEDYVVLSALSQEGHPPLYLVSDVRDNLDGLAEVCAFALLGYHRIVDLAGGHVVGLGCMDSQEALVVPQVQVGLGSVLGDITLTVFVWI